MVVPFVSSQHGDNLMVTMSVEKANLGVDRTPQHYLYVMDQLGLLRVESGGKVRTVAEIHGYMEEYGECWAGPIAVALDCTQGYVSSVMADNPELFVHVFTDDASRKYYKAV